MIENTHLPKRREQIFMVAFHRIKYFIFLILFFCGSSKVHSSCICDQLSSLDLQECSQYDAIFHGQVENVESCKNEERIIRFKVNELYKGDANVNAEVIDLCEIAECSTDFEPGTSWLVYVNKNNAQELVYNYCSHTRKLNEEGVKDYEEEVRGSSFFQDKALLEEYFEVNSHLKKGLKPRRYEKVDPKLIPVLLGVSLLFMVGGVLLFKRKSKK